MVCKKMCREVSIRKKYLSKIILGSFLITSFVVNMPAVVNAEAGGWIGTWSASPQAPFSAGVSNDGFSNATIRLIIHPHVDGDKIRIRLSNRFGKQAVTFNSVHIALQEKLAETVPNTDHAITFNKGRSEVTVLPGAEVISDDIPFNVIHDKNIALSVYVANPSGPTTWHSSAQQTSYISVNGNCVADTSAKNFNAGEDSWFWLDEIEVLANSTVKGSIVTFGDSITDGVHSTVNENHRWPDYLSDRIQREIPNHKLSVLNEGISGNRILSDTALFGVNALARLEQDVLLKNNIKAVVLLEGINDIGHGTYDAGKVIDGMKMIIAQTHAKGIRIYGGTILPFSGAKYDNPEGQITRAAVNSWIRSSNDFDGVIDFDKALRDPSDPLKLLTVYDSGDHLHPNDEGYKVMADTVDLNMIKKD